jgi:hypothetical protein
MRWAKFLASYNFQIHYQKGLENGKTDILSRRNNYRNRTKVELYSILRQNKDGFIEYNYRIQANSLIIKDKDWEKAVKAAYKKDTWA